MPRAPRSARSGGCSISPLPFDTSGGTSENNRRAKYYELTRSGQKQLDAQASAWRALTAAVGLLLDSPQQEGRS